MADLDRLAEVADDPHGLHQLARDAAAAVDGHTVNVGPVTAGITGEVDPDRLLRLYAAEVDRLRAEVAVLEQVCRDQRERVPAKTRDPESGIYIGGPSCEHPNVAYDGDRCRWCGATGDDL